MLKKPFLLFLVIFSLTGCGQKSTIKNSTEPRKIANCGDHFCLSLVVPLSEEDLITYKNPVKDLGPVVGGMAKFVGDIFAKNTNMGRVQLSFTQPIPEIPTEYLKEIRLTRLFFYIEPQEGPRKRNWFIRLFKGRDNVNFDFLNRVAVKMSTVKLEDPDNFVSRLLTENLSKKDLNSLLEVFNQRNNIHDNLVNIKEAREVMLLKYDSRDKEIYLKNGQFGKVFIIETKEPTKTKFFLERHQKLQGYFKRVHPLKNSLIVELVSDPVVEENFHLVMSEEKDVLDKLGVAFIDVCDSDSCLELSVPDFNLLDLATKGNAIKLDALIQAKKIPESFKLKGFIEFSAKSQLPF